MEENLEQTNQESPKEVVADVVETATTEVVAEEPKKDASSIVVSKKIEEDKADYKPEIVEIDLGDDANLATAHDDFDWDRGAKNELNYTESEFDDMFKQYESELNFITSRCRFA